MNQARGGGGGGEGKRRQQEGLIRNMFTGCNVGRTDRAEWWEALHAHKRQLSCQWAGVVCMGMG